MFGINQTKESEVMVSELFIITNAEDYEYMGLNLVYKKELEKLGYKFITKEIEKKAQINIQNAAAIQLHAPSSRRSLQLLQIDCLEEFTELLRNLSRFCKYSDDGEVVTVLNTVWEYGYYSLEIHDDIRD